MTDDSVSFHQVQDCVNILCRYIDNIMGNPTEPKFHKIRCSNPTFADKVAPTLGATEFLYAAGFRPQKLDQNGVQEDFWVWSEENIENLGTLEVRNVFLSFFFFLTNDLTDVNLTVDVCRIHT